MNYTETHGIGAKNSVKSKKGGFIFAVYKIAGCAVVGVAAAVMLKMLFVMNNGHQISYRTMTATIPELQATEENEKLIYKMNRFKFHAKTFSK